MKKIRVPASTANLGLSAESYPSLHVQSHCRLGPGFDVFGLSLKSTSASPKFSMCLELHIEPLPQGTSDPGNCEIICEGEGADNFSRACDENLVTQVALYVLRSHGISGSVSLAECGLRIRVTGAALTPSITLASLLPPGYICILVFLCPEV